MEKSGHHHRKKRAGYKFVTETHHHLHGEMLLRGFLSYLFVLLGFLLAKVDNQYGYDLHEWFGASIDEVHATTATVDVRATVVSMSIFPYLFCSDTTCRDEWNQCYVIPESGNVDEALLVDCGEVADAPPLRNVSGSGKP
jgi:hypothetical protein